MAGVIWSVMIWVALCVASVVRIDSCNHTLSVHQNLRLGQTLVSLNGRFELGFFNVCSGGRDAGGADLRYLGIWYKGIEPLTVVWVGNREKPLRGNDVKLFYAPGGSLMARDQEATMIFVAKLNQTLGRPLLLLENSGNLILRDIERQLDRPYVWQSFDYPSDTLLPGMKLGWDMKTGANRVLTSWKTSEDPWTGDFVFRMSTPKSPQLLLEKKGSVQSRWGPWNGKRFSGTNIKENQVFSIVYESSPDEIYFTFQVTDDSNLLRMMVTPNGAIQLLKWKNISQGWVPMVALDQDACSRYASCGPYGICHGDDSSCQCLKGFVENSPSDWGRLDCTDGCRRRTALNCSGGDGFMKFSGVKLPDNFTIWQGLNPKECSSYCLKQCNCMAYTSLDVFGNGSQCVVWFHELVDMRDSPSHGDEIYVRMARAELDSASQKKKKRNIIISCSSIGSAICALVIWYFTRRFILACFMTCKRGLLAGLGNRESMPNDNDDQIVKVYDMATISAATNGFATENQVGQGGFGTVYQGELPDGQKVAVKRLSKNSHQGVDEFKNEVHTIAQLQHRNLVRLLGCSAAGTERILIYEFLPNKSLDQIIFSNSSSRKHLLQWEKRANIIKGIARGLDYLHLGSRLRIIHRDLKASNVLLDEDMNPKISDFGLARNCEGMEEEETTKRVIGTYGYMSPEYVIEGHYSLRSDVFSFGVLAVEIISGQRNWGFHHPDHEYNLIGHAWKLWNAGTASELVDPAVEESVVMNEAIRFIHVGLLCAQHKGDERPTMPQVVGMLENESIALPEPQEPGFFTQRSAAGNAGAGLAAGWTQGSVNGLTVTSISARE
ncbi:G-type lectin S-receptor-like serine/threonine-protein kinase At4g27290 [Andrographis paniculata]|uniref:G-type lectin S-receptor-like serine/threonine-protein kinase At4g27290 n=1 Tax=Andrographis paniculata TaxID=175694 RepID=UPI0021E93E24|nr:G-type lectin S-receptor-like serine/threonine-protein kinase At4g27290 [Andrographis paniculata]